MKAIVSGVSAGFQAADARIPLISKGARRTIQQKFDCINCRDSDAIFAAGTVEGRRLSKQGVTA